MTRIEERDAIKHLHKQYRRACARLFPDLRMKEGVAVNETADKDGAFIEVTIWVPRTEAEKEQL